MASEHLETDDAIQRDLSRPINHAHPATAQFALYLVVADNRVCRERLRGWPGSIRVPHRGSNIFFISAAPRPLAVVIANNRVLREGLRSWTRSIWVRHRAEHLLNFGDAPQARVPRPNSKRELNPERFGW